MMTMRLVFQSQQQLGSGATPAVARLGSSQYSEPMTVTICRHATWPLAALENQIDVMSFIVASRTLMAMILVARLPCAN